MGVNLSQKAILQPLRNQIILVKRWNEPAKKSDFFQFLNSYLVKVSLNSLLELKKKGFFNDLKCSESPEHITKHSIFNIIKIFKK